MLEDAMEIGESPKAILRLLGAAVAEPGISGKPKASCNLFTASAGPVLSHSSALTGVLGALGGVLGLGKLS